MSSIYEFLLRQSRVQVDQTIHFDLDEYFGPLTKPAVPNSYVFYHVKDEEQDVNMAIYVSSNMAYAYIEDMEFAVVGTNLIGAFMALRNLVVKSINVNIVGFKLRLHEWYDEEDGKIVSDAQIHKFLGDAKERVHIPEYRQEKTFSELDSFFESCNIEFRRINDRYAFFDAEQKKLRFHATYCFNKLTWKNFVESSLCEFNKYFDVKMIKDDETVFLSLISR